MSNIYNQTQKLADFLEELRNLGKATLCFNFEVKYLPGKSNTITDYLSRYPKWSNEGQPMAKDAYRVPWPVEAIVRIVEAKIEQKNLDNPFLLDMKDVASADEDYQLVLNYQRRENSTRVEEDAHRVAGPQLDTCVGETGCTWWYPWNIDEIGPSQSCDSKEVPQKVA